MKRLSDYEGDEAVELWADLLDPISEILADPEVAKIVQKGSKLQIVKEILKLHKDEAAQIMQRLDPSPVNGLNIVVRLMTLVNEIGSDPDIAPFFGFAPREIKASGSSGFVTVNTGAEGN